MRYRPSSRTIFIIMSLALIPWLYISYPFWKNAFISLKTKGLSSIPAASFFYRAAFCALTLLFILAIALVIYFLIVSCVNKFQKARMSKSHPSIPLSPEEDELYSAVLKPKFPESKLRRYYFRLGVLLLCVLIVAAGSNLFFMKLKQARLQSEAATIIQKLGGQVAYDDSGVVPPDALPRLRKMLGNDFFDNVIKATFPHEARDADIGCLEALPKLDTLDLSGTNVSDAGLTSLEGLTQLNFLNLDQTKITGAGLEHLKGLSNLQELSLRKTRVSDAGLAYLEKLSKLQVLALDQTHITNPGLACLKNLKQLHTLSLRGTQLTDDCLDNLASLSHVQKLDISETLITNPGLRRLKEIPRLRSLTLGGFLITDDDLDCLKDLPYLESLTLIHTLNSDSGLEHLKGLVNLDRLTLKDTNVTDAGMKNLQKTLPKLKISR
jgi:Leucine-rich repeat (LRR) protein